MFTDRGMDKKMWCTHTVEYPSATRKNEIVPSAATWLDLEMIILSGVSQTEKPRSPMISLLCGISKQIIQMKWPAKQKETHRLRERTYGYGVWGEGQIGNLGGTCTHGYIWSEEPTRTCCIAQGILLSVMCQPECVWSFGGEWIHIYIHHWVPSLFT